MVVQDEEAIRWYRLYQDLLQHLHPDTPPEQKHEVAKNHIKKGEENKS